MTPQPLYSALASLSLGLAVTPITHWFACSVQEAVLRVTGSTEAAVYVYHALVLPGVALHELSHWVAALILRVPTGRVSLVPVPDGNGMARFGSVEIGRVDPLRESLVGLAPLVAGVTAVMAIVSGPLGLGQLPVAWADLATAGRRIFAAKDAALWLYLLTAIGNTMLPSSADRRRWTVLPPVALGAVCLALVAGGGRVPAYAVEWASRGLSYLALALGITAIVDLAAGGVVCLALRCFREHR